ncbi:MAG: hypothetical protein VR73_03705 [Gammaproteobacteria bacterium BRH_c0]|nr:MAG: hypothetical protein VR73_03705 [Gammaproteobacteria bacterium BRH_c0]
MDNNFKELYKLWDQFLARWPAQKLAEMTLDEYTGIGDKDTFTYWLERKTLPIGSIAGGSSEKFGIYRRAGEAKDFRKHMANGDSHTWNKRFGSDENSAFETIKGRILSVVAAVSAGNLDIIEEVDLSPTLKWKVAFLYQSPNKPVVLSIYLLKALREASGLQNASFADAYNALITRRGSKPILEYSFDVWASTSLANDEKGIKDKGVSESTKPVKREKIKNIPLNQILYGPPGTGKTHQTVVSAVKAADPDFYLDVVGSDTDDVTREHWLALKSRYDNLVEEKRIALVTFHQSYSYEEFVEGIRASTDDGKISYSVEPGIFRDICESAQTKAVPYEVEIKPGAKVWKLSIECAGPSKIFDDCMQTNVARIGWGKAGDLSIDPSQRTDEQNSYLATLGSQSLSSLNEFSSGAKVGDWVVVISSITNIKAVGVVSGGYYYEKSPYKHEATFQNVLPVTWIAKDFDIPFIDLNDNVNLTLKTFYHLRRVSPVEVVKLLGKHNLLPTKSTAAELTNYVLIIDEINRGNISRIFGELITLIEPSKRAGSEESLVARLPYSKKELSVPRNLYLIGTMNTADRSLALMDTALRRRFEFVEMMPDTTLFTDTPPIKGISLRTLLETLNRRIEFLYDREHTLGHAFFIPVMQALANSGEDAAFTVLSRVMHKKILPLLQEYFFEDWHKIRLVLGDNQKQDKLQFIHSIDANGNLSELFGEDTDSIQISGAGIRYVVNEDAFDSPEAYKGISSHSSAMLAVPAK